MKNDRTYHKLTILLQQLCATPQTVPFPLQRVQGPREMESGQTTKSVVELSQNVCGSGSQNRAYRANTILELSENVERSTNSDYLPQQKLQQ